MKFAKQMIAAAMTIAMCGCSGTKSDNPLFNEFTAPFGIAPFSEITIENYREGLLKGMEEQKAEIEAIVANTDAPTFENTIVALDKSGKLLSKVRGTFSPLSSSNSTEETRALEKELSPLFTSHSDDMYMNEKLFAKVKSVYDAQEGLNLNAEQKKVLENIYKRFVKSGAELSDEQKAKLRELNKEISMLQLTFSQNLLHETNNTFVTVDKVEELAGLPQNNIESAKLLRS